MSSMYLLLANRVHKLMDHTFVHNRFVNFVLKEVSKKAVLDCDCEQYLVLRRILRELSWDRVIGNIFLSSPCSSRRSILSDTK